MLKCWEADAKSRLCFKEIVAQLTKEEGSTICAIESSANMDYIHAVPHSETTNQICMHIQVE